MTLADIFSEVSGVITQFVPSFATYIAAGFIVSLTVTGVRRFIRALR